MRAVGLHSQVVAILKIVLPLVAVGMLLGLFVFQPESERGGEIVFSEADLAALGQGLRISNPTFDGVTRDADRFSFSAELVVPDAAPPQRASITALTGTIAFAGGGDMALRADGGAVDLPNQLLQLSGAVQIDTSQGYRVTADRVDVDLESGRIEGGDDVRGTGPLGRIRSGRLVVGPAAPETGDRLFTFGNGVRVIYDPPVAGP
jgi:lipopolysaccharide export system protein LptC